MGRALVVCEEKWQVNFEVWNTFYLLVTLNAKLRHLELILKENRKLVKAFGLRGCTTIITVPQEGNCQGCEK